MIDSYGPQFAVARYTLEIRKTRSKTDK